MMSKRIDGRKDGLSDQRMAAPATTIIGPFPLSWPVCQIENSQRAVENSSGNAWKTHSSNGINYKSLSLNRMKITKTEKKKKPLAWLFVSHHCPSHHHRRRHHHYQQVCHNLDLNSNSEICSSWLSGIWNYYLVGGRRGLEWGKIIWLCLSRGRINCFHGSRVVNKINFSASIAKERYWIFPSKKISSIKQCG